MDYRPWMGEDAYECAMEDEGMNPDDICEDWDYDEMGFDPYEGCYTYDC